MLDGAGFAPSYTGPRAAKLLQSFRHGRLGWRMQKRPDQIETDLPQNMGIECLSNPHPAVRDRQAVVKFQPLASFHVCTFVPEHDG